MGLGDPGGAASATIALASLADIRLGLPVSVVFTLLEGTCVHRLKRTIILLLNFIVYFIP